MAALWRRLGFDGHFAGVGSGRAAAVGDAVFAVAPCSKRRLTEWAETDVVMPEWWSAPSLNQYYRALDAVAAAKGRDRGAPVCAAVRPVESGPEAGVL